MRWIPRWQNLLEAGDFFVAMCKIQHQLCWLNYLDSNASTSQHLTDVSSAIRLRQCYNQVLAVLAVSIISVLTLLYHCGGGVSFTCVGEWAILPCALSIKLTVWVNVQTLLSKLTRGEHSEINKATINWCMYRETLFSKLIQMKHSEIFSLIIY